MAPLGIAARVSSRWTPPQRWRGEALHATTGAGCDPTRRSTLGGPGSPVGRPSANAGSGGRSETRPLPGGGGEKVGAELGPALQMRPARSNGRAGGPSRIRDAGLPRGGRPGPIRPRSPSRALHRPTRSEKNSGSRQRSPRRPRSLCGFAPAGRAMWHRAARRGPLQGPSGPIGGPLGPDGRKSGCPRTSRASRGAGTRRAPPEPPRQDPRLRAPPGRPSASPTTSRPSPTSSTRRAPSPGAEEPWPPGTSGSPRPVPPGGAAGRPGPGELPPGLASRGGGRVGVQRSGAGQRCAAAALPGAGLPIRTDWVPCGCAETEPPAGSVRSSRRASWRGARATARPRGSRRALEGRAGAASRVGWRGSDGDRVRRPHGTQSVPSGYESGGALGRPAAEGLSPCLGRSWTAGTGLGPSPPTRQYCWARASRAARFSSAL